MPSLISLTKYARTPFKLAIKTPRPSSLGFSVWLSGRVKAGQVVGAIDEFGWRAVQDLVHMNDFHATLLHLFGLDHLQLTITTADSASGSPMSLTKWSARCLPDLQLRCVHGSRFGWSFFGAHRTQLPPIA